MTLFESDSETFAEVLFILKQGNWNVEMRAELGLPPRTVPVSSHGRENGIFTLNLVPGEGLEDRFRGIITKARFEELEEKRRFEVEIQTSSFFYEDPRDPEVREKYMQMFEPRGTGLVFVRDEDAPPGWPLYVRSKTYGVYEHRTRYGSGDNLLRTILVAQPRALREGDILATGDEILSPPRQWHDGTILIHLPGAGGDYWVPIDPRVPIALRRNRKKK